MTGVMKKIPILLYSFGFAFLMSAWPGVALAQVVITEIMYDPAGVDSGHEWIEVYNSGASSIPLTTWKISVSGANHNIIMASGGKSLAPGMYAVIAESAAKFQADHPDYSGELFHSALSLDNAGASIDVRDASSTIIESVSYDSSSGALGDGNSLARPPDDAAQFSPHVPTPGSAMSSDVVPEKTKAVSAPLKTSGKYSKKTTSAAAKSPPEISPHNQGVPENSNPKATTIPSPQVAAAASSKADDPYWWLAVLAFILVATSAILTSKYFKNGEWDIVEEKPEDV
jgi:hypothetical protein